MSRVYEALQRSQGESPNPSASPLVTDQPEVAAEGASAVADEASGVPLSSAEPVDASWLNVPAERVLHPVPTPEQRLVTMTDPESTGAEMFRVLATRLAHMRRKRNLHKLLITSSVVDEGKSVVASNLALTLARRSGERVLLIEADLRRPSITPLISNSPLRGISEWSEGKLALGDSLYRIGDLPVWVLAAGHPMDEPLPLLESDRFAKMLDSVAQSFDWVLLDATPLLPMADSTSIARLVDGVLVVVRDGYTRKKVLNKAIATLDKTKLLGVVFNQASMLNVNYDQYYGSYYTSGKSKKDAEKDAKKQAKEAKKQAKREADQVKAASA
ncbi:MAG: CpsD/CapB family tyrosine-protein kinase [Candidatus Korobacteraceae bacterium]|jgi:capsular exopolysaccharide synthesis family protein